MENKKTEDETKNSGLVSIETIFNDDPFGFDQKEEDNDSSDNIEIKDKLIPAETEEEEKEESETVEDFFSSTNEDREEQQKTEVPNPVSDSLKQSLKKLGIESYFKVNEAGEDEPVDLADTVVTPELFEELVLAHNKLVQEEASKNKISIDKVSDLTKQLIEIENAGGDVTKVLREKQRVLDPMQAIDVSTKEGQVAAVVLFMQLTGKDAEDIEARVKLYEERGDLATRAEEFQVETEKLFKAYVDKQKENALKETEKQKEFWKNYKKDFSEKGLASFQLNDAAKKKLTKFAAEYTEGSGFEIDKALKELRQDPVRAAKLALFVMDEEEFIKQVSVTKVREEQVKSAIRLGIVKDSKNKKGDEFNLDTKQSGVLIPIE